jgi:Polysaccharide biosynthesis C-terminal domain
MSVAQPRVRRFPEVDVARTAIWTGVAALLGLVLAVGLAAKPPPLGLTLAAGIALIALLGLALVRFEAVVALGFLLFGVAFTEPAPPDLVFGVAIAVALVTGHFSLRRVPPFIAGPTAAFVYERAIKLSLALSLPVAVGAALLADPAVRLLYGDEFENASRALVLLSPVIALYAVNHLSLMLLVSQGRQLGVAAIYALATTASVLANAALIPLFALDGAAIGLTLSELALALVFLLAARVATGARTWPRVAGPVVAAAAAAGAILVFRSEPVAALAVGALVYLGVLACFESLVFPEDARFFLDVARARRG